MHGERRRRDNVRTWLESILGLRVHLSLSRRAQFFSLLFLVGALALIPWTVLLALTLPPKYDAGHWRLLWTGFDIALIVVLLLAAWAAWYRRQVLEVIATVAGTLLVSDAWFDMVTSFGHRDEWTTMLTGFGGELPIGIFFFWLAHRIATTTMQQLYRDTDAALRPRKLRDFKIVQIERDALGAESEENLDPPI